MFGRAKVHALRDFLAIDDEYFDCACCHDSKSLKKTKLLDVNGGSDGTPQRGCAA
ncbi:hypothetical protein CPter291_4116 [Collimonas pratensis]|uniref:Transposase n=1 Tax=Collimonas pratensis TaxID=279113 RepID=A0ABM5ZBL0_9BURK|nr:hypothetical protein CPter291_4116 [Collimonas pratensis]